MPFYVGIDMDVKHYREMIDNLNQCIAEENLEGKSIFLFGHCEATLKLADELLKRSLKPKAILDNSSVKHGISYENIPVQAPDMVLKENDGNTIVLIVTRFYEAMNAQLRSMGFEGQVRKLVDFNTYAEYSLSEQTMLRKRRRCCEGYKTLLNLEERYPGAFFILCPFPALGDVYFCMSYLPYFMKDRGIDKVTVCVSAKSCANVVRLFGMDAAIFSQKELDAAIQAVFSMQYGNAFVAHQDRPYTVNLHRALYVKKIPLEEIYRTGVFGLKGGVEPFPPTAWKEYSGLGNLRKGKTAILSPYAKSVPPLPESIWIDIIRDLKNKGYEILTNTAGEEEPLPETGAIRPAIDEMKSVVEYAGLFIGIRSGICDVIRTADCRKIALFPDYNYCDTEWRAIDMYSIDGFENIVVKEGFRWSMN